jgi:hypothetical protein
MPPGKPEAQKEEKHHENVLGFKPPIAKKIIKNGKPQLKLQRNQKRVESNIYQSPKPLTQRTQ